MQVGALVTRFTMLMWIFIALGHEAIAEPSFASDATINRIAARFSKTMNASGITGVGQDILHYYDSAINDKRAMKECVVYDVAVLIFDRGMKKVFAARGMPSDPAPLFANDVFDARQETYGSMAFSDSPNTKILVGPVAQKVLAKFYSTK